MKREEQARYSRRTHGFVGNLMIGVCACAVATLLQPLAAEPFMTGATQQSTVVTAHFEPSPPPWLGLDITVPKFDPAPGQTLISAQIVAIGRLTGNVMIENLGSSTCPDVTWTLASVFDVQLPVAAPDLQFTVSASRSTSLAPFDGTADFHGRDSVNSHLELMASDSVTVTDPTQLALLTGAGTIRFIHSAIDNSSWSGADNAEAIIINDSSLNLVVTYVYSVTGSS